MPNATISKTFFRFLTAAPHDLAKCNGNSTVADLKCAVQAERLEDYSEFGYQELDLIETEAEQFQADTPLSTIAS